MLLVLGIFVSLTAAGCAQKAANSQQAVQQSQQYQTVDEKVKYLVSQANQFLNSKEFNEAVSTAQYILSNLDKNSQEAKSILETAKAQLQQAAQGAVKDVSSALGGFGQK